MLINEFGEVGLDHLLVEEVDEQVVLLKSGCVCCSIRGDLRDGLERLHGRMESGEVPPFERVVIETTGLADPVPIVAGFTADPALRWHFRLGNVVTVVDAVNGAANLERFPEAMKQVALADRLVVSKTDLADPGALLRRLQLAQPRRPRCTSRPRAPPPRRPCCSTTCTTPTARAAEMARWAGAEPAHHDHHPGGPSTFCLTADAPLDWAAFGLWLSLLLHAHGGVDPAGEGPPAGPGGRAAGRGPGRAAPGPQAAPPRRLAGRPAADPAGDHRHRPRPRRDRALVPAPSAASGAGAPALAEQRDSQRAG